MSPRSITSLLSQHGGHSLAELPPLFLAPALQFPLIRSSFQFSKFSTTHAVAAKKRDLSKQRGVSAIHRTGPRTRLSISKYLEKNPLPRPVLPAEQEQRPLNPDHGLWGFFYPDRKAIPTPEEDYAHGRSWTIQELRNKSWEDLHRLFWLCAKERNRIATAAYERARLSAGYGDYESENRMKTVKGTQSAIKHVLRERWHAWTEARQLYENDEMPVLESVMDSTLEEDTVHINESARSS
ncbi:54S ribosomal protein L4 mitochondrial [Onygenales sp. PD_12]|nr:54S ribosomal protein L4 mitochondrial [Emmonsiellopsis sp. PD_33]KAK2783384.1 54S ribosomal protein L4 mitochondrial [Onygenales sp. PD_12]KAK2792339.1 54S ribosomal protein L4 mitochondrial [Onygenales sp. PD_10]